MAAENNDAAAEEQARAEAVQGSVRRSSAGRALVAVAVFAPALVVLRVFLLSGGSIYSHRFPGPRWPWVVLDFVLLLLGIHMMRGEDL